ncbi:HET-domain-containing protein, partial [Periconia macrospinosa]
MRLLASDTLEFATFSDENLPEYLILSHTWGDEEVSYQDMQYLQKLKKLPDSLQQDTADIENKSGYRKVTSAARAAAHRNYKYFWIDTCCIDKTSSSELQEAINSMYRWYQKATVCIALLEDVTVKRGAQLGNIHFGHLISETRWIKRGWTLQELIAPREVHFVNAGWTFLTSKSISSENLSSATGIPRYVLETGDLSQASVAQKMSWAAGRSTTRLEDRAYSLLGIFGVHIPMLYGEGAHAFIRLQEEILRVTPDDSIFYWKDDDDSSSTCRGLLAPSPTAFRNCGRVLAGP